MSMRMHTVSRDLAPQLVAAYRRQYGMTADLERLAQHLETLAQEVRFLAACPVIGLGAVERPRDRGRDADA